MTNERLQGLAPVWQPESRLLVLGSFPGEASLRAGQYYGHPRNQFWRLLGTLWGQDLAAMDYERRIEWVRLKGLAIWDVYASCQREGSLDSAIREPQLNPLPELVARMPRLRAIAHNGGESARAMRITGRLGLPVVRLPSTSPANASWSFERKLDAWRQLFEQVELI